METEPISTLPELTAFCERQRTADYITVDTEFLRDRTYWTQLCLVQIAGPNEAAAVDTLAPGLDLAPLYDLMTDQNLLKVFHAGRQDVEIFFHRMGSIPEPLFDTQVAAMVCGFGDQVGYEALISKLVGARIDKSSRFTDWSNRPLSRKQLTYAMADVTHLRPAYEKLAESLEKTGRTRWLDQEMDVLMDPETYRLDPEIAWRRIKSRNKNRRFHAILRELAAWREREAQTRDVPRNRVIRDDAILEIAAQAPTSTEALRGMRALPRGVANGGFGEAILDAVANGRNVPEADLPVLEKVEPRPAGLGPVSDLLKVLLKHVTEKHNVAPRLIASADDLERIAADDNANVRALQGWRRELFGEHALALKAGRVALTAKGSRTRVVELDNTPKSVD
ncbi:MAG: ribonuclease D [Alphaproteobacteria bacterium]|nr:ribonuclease D [Alphaproteobacteria bacterium]